VFRPDEDELDPTAILQVLVGTNESLGHERDDFGPEMGKMDGKRLVG
jgi:hypothetical protein